MSFDLSSIPNKNDLPTQPDDDTMYIRKKTQLQNRLTRQLTNANRLPLRVIIGFLTADDKMALNEALVNLGYTCVMNESGNSMTIE